MAVELCEKLVELGPVLPGEGELAMFAGHDMLQMC
jgi:hypothetical protein